MLKIRRATSADAPVIAGLVRELADYEKLLPDAKATPADFARELDAPNPVIHVLIAEWNGAPCGFAVPLGDQHVDHRVRRLEFAQEIGCRGLGVGQQLFVVGELAHQRRDQRRVRAGCRTDVEHGLRHSAMYQRMSLSRSSVKRSYGRPCPLTS